MEVDIAAVRAGDAMTVITEELQTLLGHDDHPVTVVASKAFGTARGSRQDVVGVHSAENEIASVPSALAISAAKRGVPTF